MANFGKTKSTKKKTVPKKMPKRYDNPNDDYQRKTDWKLGKQTMWYISKEDFEKFMQHIELHGFGGTDFRPVFDYVDDLIRKGEFENLKGLIYFTDGYGTFPENKPDFDVAFVFVENNRWSIPTNIPPWVIKLVLEKEDL